MKRLFLLLTLLGALLTAQAQQAALQLIHNSPDLLAASIDIYVNGNLFQDDFSFRTATAFDSVPSNTPLTVVVAPDTSNTTGNGVADGVGTFGPLSLDPGKNYVIIAEGLAFPFGYSTAANSNLNFELEVIENAASSAAAGTIAVAVSHGAPDVDEVDIFANRSENALLNDVPLKGSTEGFIPIAARDYILSIARSADSTNIVASYYLPGSALDGASATVFASGFLTTNDEPMGVEGFGLFAALADGNVVELQPIEEGTAKAQIIHNSADAAADTVDIYIDIITDTVKLANVAFRNPTKYLDVPAGYPLTVGVALKNSTGIEQSIATFKPQFNADQNHVVIAQGVVQTNVYDTTVAGSAAAVAFNLATIAPADTNNMDANMISVAVSHGATDAPSVDIFANGGANALLNDVPYGGNTGGFLSVDATEYIFGVAASADSTNILASYYINTAPLGGGAAVIFASGFLDPSKNDGGPAFGLYAVTPAGGEAIALNPIGTAQAQIVHNAADPNVDTVDIYLDLITSVVKLDNIAFRTATEFTNVPSGYPIKVAFAGKNFTDISEAIETIPTPALDDGVAYHAVANGVLNAMNFEANPEMEDIGFNLFFQAGQTTGTDANNVDLSVFHGATDAPTVDVLANGGTNPPLINDITYGDFQGYASVAALDYELGITPGADNSQVIARFLAPASGLGGRAGLILASGFFTNINTPTANEGGEPFGLLLVLDNGDELMLSPITAIENILSTEAFSVYPNPALGPQFARLSIDESSAVTMKLFDATGRQVWLRDLGQLSAGEHSIELNTANLPTGFYQLNVEGENFRGSRKIIIE
jgi:hypothetical protein